MKSLKIVPVPEKMEKYFGKGNMLHPTVEMVREIVATIPKGKITSIKLLAEKMSEIYGVDVTCPMRTGNHLKRISKESRPVRENLERDVPFWRVIRNDNTMVKLEDLPFYAHTLEEEGFALTYTASNTIKVEVSPLQWHQFE
ncbi:MGMT family protein [Spongiimicrobium salis]|uniref:hypothetical protein n=1 Tax=Spongiimicrobium salis TaxID=1667022 RepID=UPI00374CE58F